MSGQSRIHAIDIEPGDLSDAVISEYDKDGNGALSEAELTALPPVHDSRSNYDTDGNGEVSHEELEARFAKVFDPVVGLLPARCRVTRNGRGLPGAQVRFVPPQLLEGVLPPASGVTEGDGTAGLRLAPEDLPENIPNNRVVVMRPGIYLVEVTHPEMSIPSQYNTQTTLGKEVFPEILNGPPLPINLKF